MEDNTVWGNGEASTKSEDSCDNGSDQSFVKHDTEGERKSWSKTLEPSSKATRMCGIDKILEKFNSSKVQSLNLACYSDVDFAANKMD
ncbi:hypothetical protein TNCV_4999031 [Trichonephila clavipes]|nr:hypothetical protein TNCV_4999031 [Trichonephila clavipes]